MKVTMSSPLLSQEDREAVARVLDTPRLSMGPEVEAFERELAQVVGVKHAVAVSSGTAGLHLSVIAAGIAEGEWVITTPFSFVASANVLLYERAVPIFLDVEPDTGNLDPGLTAQAAADLRASAGRAGRWLPRKGRSEAGPLRGILTVDVFGQPADYEAISAAAQEHDLWVLEDSSESLGAEYRGRAAGSLGDIGVFAFYPNKQITTGEGGMVVTDHGTWADHVRALRNQGRALGDTWLQHSYLGYNYRLDEMSAALGRSQLARLEDMVGARQQVADWYHEGLSDLEPVEFMRINPDTTRMSWFVYVIRLEEGLDRDGVILDLERLGIPTRPYFAPIHLQPYMRERFGFKEGDFPVTESLGRRCLALPFSSVMTEGEVERVVSSLKRVLTGGS